MKEIELSRTDFDRFLAGLVERDERLERIPPALRAAEDEAVDDYVFSAHVEALRSDSIDGDVWGTLEDLELQAPDEAAAWQRIRDFYAERGCLLLRVEDDEYVLAEELAERLELR